MTRRERIAERSRANRQRLPSCDGYLFDQREKRIGGLRYGDRGTVADNGCGPVAIYNVMRFIGQQQDFCDILRETEELRMSWLNGRFGTKPYALGRYFTRHKIPYWKYSAPTDFKAKLLTHRIGVICTWNERLRGMHFYCIYYSYEENIYYTANLAPSSDRFVPTSLGAIVNRRFVAGYIV